MSEKNTSPSKGLQKGWTLGLAAGVAAVAPFDVWAQTTQPNTPSSVDLPPVNVQGEEPANTLNSETGISRVPGRVQDVPQIINVVPQEVLQQQNVTTLEQALRNVPGVTVTIGEGNGGMNGDRFRIRGFEAMGDSYVDGLRDFGVYVRDAFNYEQVQVLKGPSSEYFGVGTSGAAINTVTKQAFLGNRFSVDGSIGSGMWYRGTFDVNFQIDRTTAVRIVGMGNKQDIADRDFVKSDRWGVAASLGLGIGTDTSWYINYFHQSNRAVPDFGVPMLGQTATTVRRPVTEFGVPRSNFYGKDTDVDDSDVDMITSRFKFRVYDWLTVNNDTRVAFYSRLFSPTPVVCPQATCANPFFAGGNPFVNYGGGGGPSFDQKTWGFQNILSATAKFHTAFLRHELVAGFDFGYQEDKREGLAYAPAKGPQQTIWSPNTSSATYTLVKNPNNVKNADSRNYAFFVSDRIWFNDQISIAGGFRWDSQRVNYNLTTATGTAGLNANTSFWSPRASLIWEPTKNYTFYFSYATASNVPAGQYVASDVNPVIAGRERLDPERTTSFELGTKLNFFNGRLGVTGAVFQVTKNNTYITDPSTGVVSQTGEKHRVRGFEAGLTGKVTDAWTVNLSYQFLDAKVVGSTVAAVVGNPMPSVPKNAFSFWTTYDLKSVFPSMPGNLLIGGGIFYKDKMYLRSDKMSEVPAYFSLDAMVSYQYKGFRATLNAYNLTDRLNYEGLWVGSSDTNSRAIPSAGRTIVFRIGATF